MLITFAKNFLRHLHPRFLLISGDWNLRHSPQFVGQLSWLDGMGLVLGAMLLLEVVLRRSTRGIPVAYLAVSALGFLLALVPSSLTQPPPHATRSIAAWPFLALLTGAVLTVGVTRAPRLAWGVTGIGLIFMAFFRINYLTHYPAEAKLLSNRGVYWFNHDVKEAALRAQSSGDWEAFRSQASPFFRPLFKYYLIHYANMPCREAERFLQHGRDAP